MGYQNIGLGLLLAVWAALLFGGFILGQPQADGTRRMPTWTRMASSLVLVLAGGGFYLASRGTVMETYALLIAVGMLLGFIGDLFMANLIRIPNFEHVLGGMAAFGLGHVLYIAAIITLTQQLDLAFVWLALVVCLLVGVVGWYVVVFRGQQPTVLHYAALPYALLLASTTGVALSLALSIPAFGLLALGAALFLASDLILATQLFNNLRFPLISDVVWLTYGPAQMLIVYSVGTALGLLA